MRSCRCRASRRERVHLAPAIRWSIPQKAHPTHHARARHSQESGSAATDWQPEEPTCHGRNRWNAKGRAPAYQISPPGDKTGACCPHLQKASLLLLFVDGLLRERQKAFSKLFGGAEILVRQLQLAEGGRVDVTVDLRHFREYFGKMPTTRSAFSRSFFENFMSRVAPEFGSQQHHGALSKNDAASGLDVRAHARSVYRESFRNLCHRGRCDARRLDNGSDDRPLRLPATDCALVLLHHRRKKVCHFARDAMRCGKRYGACDRIPLVRHGGRAATTLSTRFSSFGNFILHKKTDVTGHFAQG